MKRYKLLFIALALIVVFTACNKRTPNNNESNNNNSMSVDNGLSEENSTSNYNSSTEDSNISADNDVSVTNSNTEEDNITGQNIIHYASDGVYIDFGCLLKDGDEVIVEKVEPAPIDEDVTIYAYDISLSSGQPEGAIEIVIPYNDDGLDKNEEHLSVCGKYLNESTNLWEDVFYTVDTKANEVHIITDHLSIYSAFTFSNLKKRDEYISEVNSYASNMSNEQALVVLNAYAKQGDYWQADVVGAFLDTTSYTPYYIESNVHTLLTLGDAYDVLITKPFQKAMTGLSISTACTQLAYDLYNNGVYTTETAASALKSSLSIAINFATPSIKLAYLGVGIVDIALTDVQTYATAERYRSTKNMYEAYYKRNNVRRNLSDWRKLFEKIYKDNKDQPQTALDMMTGEIDRYVNEYWEVAAVDWDSWIDAYDKNGNLSKYPWPGKKDRENISAIHKKNIYDNLKALFHTMCRNMYLDSFIERQNEYEKLARSYNQQYSILIREDVESGEKATWAGYYARLAPLSSKAEPSSWTGKLDSDGGGRITFTLIAHQKAGFPMTLEIYRTKADIESGNKLRTITLKPFCDNEQTVILEPLKKTEAEDDEVKDDTTTDDNIPNDDSPDNPPLEDPPKEDPPVIKLPVQVDNPWYDVTIISQDIERPKAFVGWYAVLAYPEDMEIVLKDMYGMFNNKGECKLYFQESDYETLDAPSNIWLYVNEVDLLAKKKPDVTVKFSISSASREGTRDGEALYSILVKAKPPAKKEDILDNINGNYSSYMEYSEMFIPGEGMMEIDRKKNYEPYESPSANVWLHYNGTSLTFKSAADPYSTEHVLEKLTDTRYEIEYDKDGTKVKHSIVIHSIGNTAQYTYTSESESGTKYLQRYYLYK